MSRIIVPVFAFAVILGLSLSVIHAGDVKDIAARQKAAVQKLTDQVTKGIADSRKLDPAEAKFLLEGLRRDVKDANMFEAERAPLLKSLNTRIAQLDEADRGAKITQGQKVLSDPPSKKPFTIPTADPRPGGAAGYAKDTIASRKGTVNSISDSVRDRERGVLAAINDREKVLPMDKEINFPKNWREISDRRKDMVSQKLTPTEIALLKTLNSTMSVKYDNDKFKAVIEHLHDRTGLNIIVDEGSLRDINVDYDDPVSFKVEKASVRTILKKVLGDKGLTYIIKEGAIQVMTPKKASEYTVVRSYPISDLISPVQSNLMFGPGFQIFQKRQNAQQVINLIVSMTGQDYWQPNGPGNIAYFEPGEALMIRASSEMHYQLASPGLFGR